MSWRKEHEHSNGAASSPPENRPLTALRGLAALWVVGSHLTDSLSAHWSGWTWHVLRAGYMGVDIFFVLSGFILAVVYGKLTIAGVPRFLLKRILRVYPLNVVTLLIYAALAATVMNIGSWANWHLLPWFLLMLEAYLPKLAAAWNPVTWSVGIELACYLCFPIVIVWIRRLPIVALAALAVSLLAEIYWAQGWCLGWPWGWRALARGMSDFWPGVVFGVLALRLPRPAMRWSTFGELICVGGVGAAVVFDALRLVPVFSAGLVLLLFFDTGLVARVLRAGWCFWLGRISFSIYLLHALLLGPALPYASVLSWHMPWSAAVPVFVVCFVGVVLFLSHVTYLTIEQPGRRLARWWPPPFAPAGPRRPARIKPSELPRRPTL